jgi:hypothetical protein
MKMEQAWMAYTQWLMIMITYRNSNEMSRIKYFYTLLG